MKGLQMSVRKKVIGLLQSLGDDVENTLSLAATLNDSDARAFLSAKLYHIAQAWHFLAGLVPVAATAIANAPPFEADVFEAHLEDITEDALALDDAELGGAGD